MNDDKRHSAVITRVCVWENGMVMVFDQRGEQMPDYQGPKDAVWANILRDAPPDVEIEDNMNWEREKHRFFPGGSALNKGHMPIDDEVAAMLEWGLRDYTVVTRMVDTFGLPTIRPQAFYLLDHDGKEVLSALTGEELIAMYREKGAML